jgi:hypothetical protein
MSTSDKKVAANRINGLKSNGPKNTQSTRFNARKHGLLAVGITELDDAEGYRNTLLQLTREKEPVGELEKFLVQAAALDMVRWQRARRLEAEFITGELNPPLLGPGLADIGSILSEGEVLDPGLPAPINSESGHRLVNIFQRYETSIANRLFRTFHELERLQRTRRGEILPAPANLDIDINVHSDPKVVDSVPPEPSQTTALDGNNEECGEHSITKRTQ